MSTQIHSSDRSAARDLGHPAAVARSRRDAVPATRAVGPNGACRSVRAPVNMALEGFEEVKAGGGDSTEANEPSVSELG